MKKIWKEERFQVLVLVLAAFALLTAWAFMQPLGAGPDEKMRYMVAQYLHKHPGKLPLGDEPTIRDATWGISYAYYPILSYMVSAVFMGIAGLFHASADGLLHAARMADVLFRSCWLLEWRSVHCPTIMLTAGSYAASCFSA